MVRDPKIGGMERIRQRDMSGVMKANRRGSFLAEMEEVEEFSDYRAGVPEGKVVVVWEGAWEKDGK